MRMPVWQQPWLFVAGDVARLIRLASGLLFLSLHRFIQAFSVAVLSLALE